MGVIKDGTISGTLPENVGFAVHYPGYPSSTARAVGTLGGSEGILKAHSLHSEPLKLRFRPEDPYSHPAFGYLRPCSNLLLKISKRREDPNDVVLESTSESSLMDVNAQNSIISHCEIVKNGNENTVSENPQAAGNIGNQPQTDASAGAQLSADIVSRVSEAYHFNGMVDYQHVLAVHAHAGKNKKRRRNKADEEPDFDEEDVMILVPPLFSPKDVPEKLVLKPSATMSSKKKQEAIVKQRWEMQIEPCLAIEFSIKEVPRKINWEDNIPRGSDHWELQMAVSKLFDERPIWHSHSFYHRLLDKGVTVGAHMLKRLLFRTAYYFSTGPYRRFWIKKGYDPRKDPESRVYQTIDFRVPPPLRGLGDADSTDRLRRMWKQICAFQVFPCKCQTSLQLFELVDDYIQAEIRKTPEETCSSSTGWFSPNVLECLTLRVAVRFLSVYPKPGAEIILKSKTSRFEKSKRANALKRDFRPKEIEIHNNNNVSSKVVKQIKGPPELVNEVDGKDESDDDEDNNDGYDEIEEEEEEDEEEELDDYDSYQEELLLDPVGENISKNYLQELFGSFPSSEAGNNKDAAECSDAEYQIFEQDGDNDNYSDADDDY